MKGLIYIIILVCCMFTFIPMFVLLIEHIFSGRDSILQKLLDGITE